MRGIAPSMTGASHKTPMRPARAQDGTTIPSAASGFLALALLRGLMGCATSGGHEDGGSRPSPAGDGKARMEDAPSSQWGNPTPDPLEPYNRWIFTFNEVADQYVARPVAVAYRDSVPEGARRSAGHFLSNLRAPFYAANHYLQGDFRQGTRSVTRFLINSTIGLLGLLDVAGAAGLDKQETDLGLTLGHWGVPRGPYLVLPILGPSTVRDSTGLLVEHYGRDYHRPMQWAGTGLPARYSRSVLSGIDTRVELLSMDELMYDTGADPYIFLRESFLQNRRERLSEDEWGDWDTSGDWSRGGGSFEEGR